MVVGWGLGGVWWDRVEVEVGGIEREQYVARMVYIEQCGNEARGILLTCRSRNRREKNNDRNRIEV